MYLSSIGGQFTRPLRLATLLPRNSFISGIIRPFRDNAKHPLIASFRTTTPMTISTLRRLRIAILEADYPQPLTASKYGSYGGVFVKLLAAGAKELDIPVGDLTITTWDVQREIYPCLEDVDAVLITGSRANAFDNTPWIVKLMEFTRKILEEQSRVRVIGVCFGHQIIGRALGANIVRNIDGWEASVTPVHLSSRGQELFDGKYVLNIHQMHRDLIVRAPEGTENLGSTHLCQVQGLYAQKRLISLQGHPEFTSDIAREILEIRKKNGIITHAMFTEMIRKVDDKHDGVIVACAFLNFLRE